MWPSAPRRISAIAIADPGSAASEAKAATSPAVASEAPVQVSAEDGLRAVAIGVAAEISAREHRVVEMRELGL